MLHGMNEDIKCIKFATDCTIKGNLGAIEEHEGIEQSKEKRNTTLPGRTRQTRNKRHYRPERGRYKRGLGVIIIPDLFLLLFEGQQREKKGCKWKKER